MSPCEEIPAQARGVQGLVAPVRAAVVNGCRTRDASGDSGGPQGGSSGSLYRAKGTHSLATATAATDDGPGQNGTHPGDSARWPQ